MTEPTDGSRRTLASRPWFPAASDALVATIAERVASQDAERIDGWLHDLVDANAEIHERHCINLNPATNVMNPRAEALLASGLGVRPSLGHPGDKYETGLEAIEQIEVIAAELAAATFGARFAEIRVPSGAIANLYAFMACARPGDAVIVPPPTIGGHVTHHRAGAAGLYGLEIHEAPIDAGRYTVDVEQLAVLARRVRPAVMSVGGSLNLFPHPVAEIRRIADDVGATVLFDAAHLSGPIAGGAWPDPLAAGAHVMTMSTYKSLGGPPSGLLVTDDEEIARRVDTIAFPGLTANFDVAKSAALAMTLLDWREHGTAYAAAMCANARRLAQELFERRVPVVAHGGVATTSHAFALDATALGGGTSCARTLRSANLLASSIGLPSGLDAGLRIGTNEITRWGMTPDDMPELAALLATALDADDPAAVGPAVTEFRSRFTTVNYVREPSSNRSPAST